MRRLYSALSLFLLPFSVLAQGAGESTVTLSLTDPAVTLAGQWQTAGSDDGLFAFTDDLTATASINLPLGTTSIDYAGLKRTGGSTYAFCVDCDVGGDDQSFTTVSANDPSSQDDNSTIIIFTQGNLDPTVSHTLVVSNIPDANFDNTSEITFASLIASVSEGQGGSSSISGSTTSTSGSPPGTSATSAANPDTTTPPAASGTSISSSQTTSSASGSIGTSSGSGSPSGSSTTSSSSSQETQGISTGIGTPSATQTSDDNNPTAASGSAGDSSSPHKSQKISGALIAVIAVIAVTMLITILIAALVYVRNRRRRQSMIRGSLLDDRDASGWIPDAETGPRFSSSNAAAPIASLYMRNTEAAQPVVPVAPPARRQPAQVFNDSVARNPIRPPNPFEDMPSDVPIDHPEHSQKMSMSSVGSPRPMSDYNGNAWVSRRLNK